MTRCIASHALLNDRGERFIAHHELASPFNLLGLVSPWRRKGIIARTESRLHAIAGLLGILDARMGADRSEQMFDKLAIAILAKFRSEEHTSELKSLMPISYAV